MCRKPQVVECNFSLIDIVTFGTCGSSRLASRKKLTKRGEMKGLPPHVYGGEAVCGA